MKYHLIQLWQEKLVLLQAQVPGEEAAPGAPLRPGLIRLRGEQAPGGEYKPLCQCPMNTN